MKIITTQRFRTLCSSVGSAAIAYGSIFLLSGIGAGLILMLRLGNSMTLHLKESNSTVAMADVNTPTLLAITLCFNAYTVSLFLFCLTLRGLMRSYRRGLYFDRTITHAYYRLAAFEFAMWLVQFPGAIVVTHLPISPPTMLWFGFFNFAFFNFDFTSLCLAIIFLILAQVMNEGARVQEEQSLTV